MERCASSFASNSYAASFSYFPKLNMPMRQSTMTPPPECRSPPVSMRLSYENSSPVPSTDFISSLDFGGANFRLSQTDPAALGLGKRSSCVCEQSCSTTSNHLYDRKPLSTLPLAVHNIPPYGSQPYPSRTWKGSPVLSNNTFVSQASCDESFQLHRLSPEVLPLTQPMDEEEEAEMRPEGFESTLPIGQSNVYLTDRFNTFNHDPIYTDDANVTPRVHFCPEQSRGGGSLHYRGGYGSGMHSHLDSPAPMSAPHSHVTFMTPSFSHAAANLHFVETAAAMQTPQTSRVKSETRQFLDLELNATNNAHRTEAPQLVTQVTDRIYLGGFPGSETRAQLRALGITRMINCCAKQQRLTPTESLGFDVFNVDARDSDDYFILYHHLEAFSAEMDSILNSPDEKVFVHCIGGVNRSVSLVVAYMVQKLNFTPVEAVRRFREQGRKVILLNNGFRTEIVDHYLEKCRPDLNDEDSQ